MVQTKTLHILCDKESMIQIKKRNNPYVHKSGLAYLVFIATGTYRKHCTIQFTI